MAPCSDIYHPIVNCSSKLAPVFAKEVPVDAGPNMAPCPMANDRVEEENDHLVIMPMINLCPQGDLGEDGMLSVLRVILDPTPSVLSMNPQLDDKPPADAESIESLALFSSPSPHAAPADQHGKAPGSAQLALVFYQERQLSSFAEVVRRGMDAAVEGLSSASAIPISIRLITDVDRLEALGPKDASNMLEPLFLDCAVAALDAVPSRLPPELVSVEDPAVDHSHSPHDALFIHHDLDPLVAVDLDITPNSISRLSSKYSLDTSNNVGSKTISPSGSLADVRAGQAPDVSRVKYYSAKDVIAMQYGPWKPAKSQRQRKSASKNSKEPSGSLAFYRLGLRVWGWAGIEVSFGRPLMPLMFIAGFCQ